MNGEKHKGANGRLTLDSIIPWPSDYEGFNHPFKTVLERNQELETNRFKERLLSSYTNGYGNDTESDTMTTDSESVSQYDYRFLPKPRKKPGRKSKADIALLEAALRKEEELEMLRKKPRKVPNHAKNVIEKSMLDNMSHKEIPLKQLKSSVQTYFGAADRLASGESFQVLARRISTEGKIQYLVEWQGLHHH